MRFKAFTLIELLVVVTIIVILLALLTPALESALYQAELATDGANQKGIVGAASQYAAANNQRYPKRQNNYGWDALMMRNRDAALDFFPMWDPYVPRKMFVDPFSGEIDLSNEANRPHVVLYSNYHVYSGLPRGAGSAIDRLGQKWSFTDTKSDPANPRLYKFGILVGDRNHFWPEHNGWTTSAHPDDEGVLAFQQFQDENNQGDPTPIPLRSYDLTLSWWSAGRGHHGKVDLHFGYDDNSVLRTDDVEMHDERMAKVADTGQAEYDGGRYAHVPKAQ